MPTITNNSSNQSAGQVFLITVFVISVAMFLSLLALSPVRNKIIQIKEMENIYQALANTEKALEAFSYYSLYGNEPFTGLAFSSTIDVNAFTCAFYTTTTPGNCKKITMSSDNNEFSASAYLFETSSEIFFNVTFFFGYVRNISRSLIEK